MHQSLSTGDDAFQPQTYGKTITVQRRITASGSSTWRLSDQDGRKVRATALSTCEPAARAGQQLAATGYLLHAS